MYVFGMHAQTEAHPAHTMGAMSTKRPLKPMAAMFDSFQNSVKTQPNAIAICGLVSLA
jgi:hypothetical protein